MKPLLFFFFPRCLLRLNWRSYNYSPGGSPPSSNVWVLVFILCFIIPPSPHPSPPALSTVRGTIRRGKNTYVGCEGCPRQRGPPGAGGGSPASRRCPGPCRRPGPVEGRGCGEEDGRQTSPAGLSERAPRRPALPPLPPGRPGRGCPAAPPGLGAALLPPPGARGPLRSAARGSAPCFPGLSRVLGPRHSNVLRGAGLGAARHWPRRHSPMGVRAAHWPGAAVHQPAADCVRLGWAASPSLPVSGGGCGCGAGAGGGAQRRAARALAR